MRKALFFLFGVVYCYAAVYFLLNSPYGEVSDWKPRMSRSFFFYSYTSQDVFFPSNEVASTKHREFYYYLFQPIDWLVTPCREEVQTDEME